MTNLTINQAWDKLIKIGVSQQTLEIITCINGYKMETLQDVLYVYSGYRNFEQLED